MSHQVYESDILLTLFEKATSNFSCNLLQHLNMLLAYSELIVNYLFRNVNDSNELSGGIDYQL